MKRSEINAARKELEAMVNEYKFALPPFCYFTPGEWQEKGHEYDEVRGCMLGWDITDYGMDDFDKMGISLITIRNGNRFHPPLWVDSRPLRRTNLPTACCAMSIPRRRIKMEECPEDSGLRGICLY